MRTEAFQVQLVVQPESEARRSALAALRNSHPKRKAIALRYLAHGPGSLNTLPSGFMLFFVSTYSYSSGSDGNPIVPQPPAGLKLRDVRPLMDDADAETAASAGYLAVLLGDSDGMAPLLRYWRGSQQGVGPLGQVGLSGHRRRRRSEVHPGAAGHLCQTRKI